MTITEKQISELRNIREISFKKTKSFTDYSLASGIEEIDLTKVKGKAKELLIAFFKKQLNPKRTDRTKTIDIYRQTKNGKYNEVCIITYRALHGFGYAWSQDLENEFISWLIKTYNINKRSKTYRVLLLRSIFTF